MRRMPVLPQLSCYGCPCISSVGAFGNMCSASKLFAQHCVRPVACIADELALRNVAAGLFAVAVHLSTEHGFYVVGQYWCIRGEIDADKICTCKWCKPVDAQKLAPA